MRSDIQYAFALKWQWSGGPDGRELGFANARLGWVGAYEMNRCWTPKFASQLAHDLCRPPRGT